MPILTWKFCAVSLSCGIFVKLLQAYFVWNISILNQYNFSKILLHAKYKDINSRAIR